jgi:hypothetical protein
MTRSAKGSLQHCLLDQVAERVSMLRPLGLPYHLVMDMLQIRGRIAARSARWFQCHYKVRRTADHLLGVYGG